MLGRLTSADRTEAGGEIKYGGFTLWCHSSFTEPISSRQVLCVINSGKNMEKDVVYVYVML